MGDSTVLELQGCRLGEEENAPLGVRAPDVVADEVGAAPPAPRPNGGGVVPQSREVPGATPPEAMETEVGSRGPCPQFTPNTVEFTTGEKDVCSPTVAPLQDAGDPSGKIGREGTPDVLVLPGGPLEGSELHATPGEGGRREGGGFPKAEAIGQGKANNRDATEVVVVSAVAKQLHDGGEWEPVAVPGGLERQALAALGEPPPGAGDVERQRPQVPGTLHGRKGEPERGGRETTCQALEKKFLDQASRFRRGARQVAGGQEVPEVASVLGE